MSQNQREAWERVQLMLQRRKGGFGGIPGGGRGGGMGLAGLVLLGVGSWALSNSLFNGMLSPHGSTNDLNLIFLFS
jgi:prohibitin 2